MRAQTSEESFLLSRLNGLLKSIDTGLVQLERFRRNPRLSEGVRRQVDDKIEELRQSKMEIHRLIARVEARVRR